MDVVGNGAQKIVFCEPALHLLLNPEAILVPILDLADAIIFFFREKKITKVACLGIEGQLLRDISIRLTHMESLFFLLTNCIMNALRNQKRSTLLLRYHLEK